ncbi:MAG: FAD-dependent oxidoreductase [Acidobacteria bacterium]|nr:FAD-dependent oxidoreductase [Acidobacteriota bacterium]
MLVLTIPILTTHAATPRSRLVTLDLQGYRLDFQPGQAVLVGAHGQLERRPYSIACSPQRAAESDTLELLIATDPDGALGANFGAASEGTLVDVEGPVGTFTLPPMVHARWVLFVAGGTGIAPLRSMLDHLLRQGPAHRLSLLYSARRADEFAFIDEFKVHAEAGRLELHPTVTRDQSLSWTGRRGRIGRDHFEAVIHEPDATLCFVCGPDSLVGESVATLRALGVPEAQIRTESWGR